MRTLTVAAACLALSACSQKPAMDEQMKLDLQAASASSVELAPRSGGTKVTSAMEQTPRATPRQTPVRQTQQPAPTPPQTEPAVTPVRAAQPPKVSPPPPGGYKTMDEVLRKAPFPIKPATTTRRP
jgi:hypothetical protein